MESYNDYQSPKTIKELLSSNKIARQRGHFMKYEEVKRILVEKGLTNYKFFAAPNYEPNNVGIIKNGLDYEVFATSERGTPAGIKKFKTEEEALDNFISRVESLNRLIEKNPSLFL